MILRTSSPKSNFGADLARPPEIRRPMPFLRLYARVLGLLRPVIWMALALAAGNVALAFTLFAEPLLFGKVIDRLAGAQSAGTVPQWVALRPWLALWAASGCLDLRQRGRLRCTPIGSRIEAASRPWRPISNTWCICRSASTRARIRAFAQGDDRGLDGHVRGLAVVLPRAFRRARGDLVLLPTTLAVNWRLGAILIVLVWCSAS